MMGVVGLPLEMCLCSGKARGGSWSGWASESLCLY